MLDGQRKVQVQICGFLVFWFPIRSGPGPGGGSGRTKEDEKWEDNLLGRLTERVVKRGSRKAIVAIVLLAVVVNGGYFCPHDGRDSHASLIGSWGGEFRLRFRIVGSKKN